LAILRNCFVHACGVCISRIRVLFSLAQAGIMMFTALIVLGYN